MAERERPGLPEHGVAHPPSTLRLALEVPLLLVVALAAAFLLKTFVAQAFFIPSASMEPQLREGDRVVVSRMSYRLHDPRRGDVIVFDAPEAIAERLDPDGGDDEGALPLRVARELLESVGLRHPSDTEFIKRVIGLPGEAIQARGGRVFVDGHELIEPYLPPGTATSDFGPVVVPPGHVFVLGDNRPDSEDSRFIGPVPIDSIVGRAVLRAWPPDRWAFL